MKLRRYRLCSPVYVSDSYSSIYFFSLKNALRLFVHCKDGYSLEEWNDGRWVKINVVSS